ncbi:MAG: hypothetical protein V1891_02990 [bacterium]
MTKKFILIAIGAVIIVGAASFYGGMTYGKYNKSFQANMSQRTNSNFQQFRQGMGNRAGEGLVNGEIIKKDDESITVKLRDGGSKIIYISNKTGIMKSVDGVKDDLEIGENAMVNGKVNSDGSIAAETIQLRKNIKLQNRD